MASKKPTKTAIDFALLALIVAAGTAGTFAAQAATAPMVAELLVEVNPDMKNDAGEIATRATEKGVQVSNENSGKTVSAPVVKPAFEIETGIALPAGSTRGGKATLYPFEQLEVDQSFFVPNSEDKPNVAKSLASTVSSATARYAEVDPSGATKANKAGEQVPVMIATRQFVVRPDKKGDVSGARVFRTK